MKITKLEAQKRDPNRANVYVDGKFFAGLDLNDILELGLHSGQEIDETQYKRILSESEFGKFYSSALVLLSKRPRSEREIVDNLKQKAYRAMRKNAKEIPESESIIKLVIEKLRKLGYLNDEEFARWYQEQRATFKPKGKIAIKTELLRKGIDRKIIGSLFTNSIINNESASEKDLALKALQKKIVVFSKRYSNPRELKEKLIRFLLSRGFDWEDSKETVEKVLRKE